jgi:hypothetical protein
MPRVLDPKGNPIDFPDTMSMGEIEVAMGRLFPKPVPGMEKLGGPPPPIPNTTGSGSKGALGRGVPMPDALKTDDEAGNPFWTSPRGLIRSGLRQAASAIPSLAAGHKAEAVSNAVEGAGEAMAPAAIGATVINPVAALGAAAGGTGASLLGRSIANHFKASPETQRAVGDVASIPGAMLGGRVGYAMQPSLGTMKAMATNPDVHDAMIQMIPRGDKILKFKSALQDARTSANAPATVPPQPTNPAPATPTPTQQPVTPTPQAAPTAQSSYAPPAPDFDAKLAQARQSVGLSSSPPAPDVPAYGPKTYQSTPSANLASKPKAMSAAQALANAIFNATKGQP